MASVLQLQIFIEIGGTISKT